MSKNETEKQKRALNCESIRSEMASRGFKEKVCTISILKASLMALIIATPIVIACLFIYYLKWGEFVFYIYPLGTFLFLIALIVCAVVHEVIHGLTWSMFCKHRWSSIHFGVIWKALTPYCHCKETLKFGGYILGGLMPFIVLGIGLFVLSLILGNVILLVISLINIIGAGGDITMAFMLLRYKNSLVFDHPTDCGFIVFFK